MMKIVTKDNTSIEEEKKHIELLDELIKDDEKRKDFKSKKYHTMALEKHKKKLKDDKTMVKRKLDNLGRLVIPKDYRIKLNLKANDYVNLKLLDDNTILLKKYNFSVNYEEIIRNALISTKGIEYSDYYISSKQIETLNKIINDFIEKNYIK